MGFCQQLPQNQQYHADFPFSHYHDPSKSVSSQRHPEDFLSVDDDDNDDEDHEDADDVHDGGHLRNCMRGNAVICSMALNFS